MRRGIAAVLLVPLLLPACRPGDRARASEVATAAGSIAPLPEEQVVEPATPADSVRVETIWDYVDAIDRWLEDRPDDERLFARLDDGRWIAVADPATWPDGTVIGAGVLADASGIVRQVFLAPVGGTDGGFTVHTYAFDDAGRTVYFERAASIPGGACAPGRAHETSSYIFDEGGGLVAKTYERVDDEDRPLDVAACTLPARAEYRIERSAGALLRATGLDTVVDAVGDARVPVIS